MIDVRVLLVQLRRQALGLSLLEELRPGSDTSAYGGFPMDSVRFHTTRVWEPSIQLLLSQAGSGSLATTMMPWMDLVSALRTVFKAVELTSPAPFKPVPLMAATIAFFNASILSECFVFMFVLFRLDVLFCGCIFVAWPRIPGQQGRSGFDNSHAIFRAQGISNSLPGGGIILPHSVGIEPVFVTARSERHTEPPDTVSPFMHGRDLDVPVVEVAGQ